MANDKPPQGGPDSDGLSNDALLKTSNAGIELSEGDMDKVAGGAPVDKQKSAQKSADAADAFVRG